MARKPPGRKTIGVENAVHYRGVRMRRRGKFVAEIQNPATKSGIWLGTYYTEVEAARAYDTAARRLHGHNARTNFPLFGGGAASQDFGKNLNFLVSSPLDLTLAPPRNFPAECYHLLCHFSAVHRFGHRRRRLPAMSPPPLGLKLSRKSMKEIILAYEELRVAQAVKPRPDGLDLDLNRPPPEDVNGAIAN